MKDLTDDIAKRLKSASKKLEDNDLVGCNRIIKNLIKNFTDEYMIQKSEYVVVKRRELEEVGKEIERIGIEFRDFE